MLFERVKQGSVHGRFQPFHNGHLDYVLQAFDRADFLFVGLTQIYRPKSDGAGRDDPASNPLSFYERAGLVTAALAEAGIDRERFSVTPFPIEQPERLNEFIPTAVRCFTTIVTDWNDAKIGKLHGEGYTTEILNVSIANESRVASGTEIRKLIRDGDDAWIRFVPPAVAQRITNGLLERFLLDGFQVS